MHPNLVRQIPKLNYIIIENDYKICNSRHPWRWPNSIIPKSERVNYDLYKNAKAVFVQTTDHYNVYKTNEVEGKFINLNSSIWDEKDLQLLEQIFYDTKNKSNSYAIYDTDNWIKNKTGAINYCMSNNIEYQLVPNSSNRETFLRGLSECKGLVFLPIARETFCRLVVEAKCFGLDVVTTKNYGASLEPWFDMVGQEMIDFLRMNTEHNLNKINKYLPN
jgi:hypothetical protein